MRLATKAHIDANKLLVWFFTSKYSLNKNINNGGIFTRKDVLQYGPSRIRDKKSVRNAIFVLKRLCFIEDFGNGYKVLQKSSDVFQKISKKIGEHNES